MDFFTPIVDDPYAYGQIAAANALSDVYAMGGVPLTVLNIVCCDPSAAPAEVWASVLQGMADKTAEAGAVILGGHSVEDDEPKFGMAVTGLVDPDRIFDNRNAKPGDRIFLSKPLGTGVITTAAKQDRCRASTLDAAISSMATLNAKASEAAHTAGARCATDITGFGLAGHLFNIASESGVRIRLNFEALPLLPDVEDLILAGATTGGGGKNRRHLAEALSVSSSLPNWAEDLVVDPQTSGGLAVLAREPVAGSIEIGVVEEGSAAIIVE